MTRDQSSPPPRSRLVAAAAALFGLLMACLVIVAIDYAVHVTNIRENLARATSVTSRQPPVVVDVMSGGSRLIGRQLHPVVINRKPAGLDEVAYYARDITVLALVTILLAVMIISFRRLWRGSSSSRNIALILAAIIGIGGPVFGVAFGHLTETYDGDPRSFEAIYTVFEKASTPGWAEVVLQPAIIALPLIVLCFAVLVLSPPATRYFRAMRRSGTY